MSRRNIRWVVEGPDGLPIEPRTYPSQAAAERARTKWCDRFRVQGYYKAVHRRIELPDLPFHCVVRPQLPGERA